MTWHGWAEVVVYVLLVGLTVKPVGLYLHRVFESAWRPRVWGALEHRCYRLLGVDPAREHSWREYAGGILAFSAIGIAGTYAIERLQHVLPLNPQHLPAVPPALAFNTAVSFVTNTNWQAYAGESTMSYLTQMAALAWHNFTSAAVGLAVALAMARGFTRRLPPGAPRTLGNVWVDLVRAHLCVLLPASTLVALVLAMQGVVQSCAPSHVVTTLEGARQVIAVGPVASQEAIKLLGTNGGGFFNANSAHPFENPTPLTNVLEMVLILIIPAGLTYTYGRMARSARHGWALLAAMTVFFLAGVTTAYWAEAHPNPALHGVPVAQAHAGNLEGKETRFGLAASALFATVTTDASCGAVNAMHDSFTPLGGLVPLLNIQLGEVIFGGVGAGLYGMLVFVVLAVFIAGLMVGRTPEYLGKKIGVAEMQVAMLYVLVFPLLVLSGTAIAAVSHAGAAAVANRGPHGLSEMLYAFTSAGGNNGSAFAGLTANTPFWNWALGLSMLAGRFWMIVPVLALAGSMVGKSTVPAGPGTFPTDGVLFVVLLVGVIAIVGALTFFPALCLGPVLEHAAALRGKVF